MSKKIPPVCGWLLEQFPDIVCSLPRDQDGLVIVASDTERRSFLGVAARLIVPENIKVFQAIYDFPGNEQPFFITEGRLESAYLSLVKPVLRQEGEKNEYDLSKLIWFNTEDSSRVFNRMCKKKRDLGIYGLRYDSHPLLGN